MAPTRIGNTALPGAEYLLGRTISEERTVDGLADGTLLDRWREHRDGDAFAELARRHSSVVFDLTVRVLGDRAAAEDVLQEALLSLALERTGKPAEVGVVAWLARFAICRARNRRASERSRARRQWIVGSERPEADMPDEALEHRDELERALAGCEPDDRALLAMRFLYGWDYDRIAAALSITPGAARVRVHRALGAVRARVRSDSGAHVAPALAALPIVPLSASRLDAVVGEAVAIAQVQLGAPPNGVEHATASSSSFQAAVGFAGAVLLFVGLAGAAASPIAEGWTSSAAPEVASVAPGGALPPTALVSPDGGQGAAGDGFAAAPRAPYWDRGALRRAAIDGLDDHAAPLPPPAASAAPASPASDVPAASAQDAVAPAAGAGPESPNASRPTSRAACAAKGEPASPDGERAGAFGGSLSFPVPTSAPADEPGAPPAPTVAVVVRAAPESSAAGGASARRAPLATFEDLPPETQELLGAAEDLVRRMLAGDDDALAVDASGSVRGSARAVRLRYRALRKDEAASGAHTDRLGKAARVRRAAAVRRVLTLLTQVVLSEARATGDVRWPQGADVDAALADLVRILGGATAVPSGADADADGPRLPSGIGEAAE